jgi:hypothetical protein
VFQPRPMRSRVTPPVELCVHAPLRPRTCLCLPRFSLFVLTLCWARAMSTVLYLLMAFVAITSAAPPFQLWLMTGGALHELRRATIDGSMLEQVLVPNLDLPNSGSFIRWLEVENEVAYWTDAIPLPSVRKFDPDLAVPGQGTSTMIEDPTGFLSYGALAVFNANVYVVETSSGSILEISNSSTLAVPMARIVKSGLGANVTGLALVCCFLVLFPRLTFGCRAMMELSCTGCRLTESVQSSLPAPLPTTTPL